MMVLSLSGFNALKKKNWPPCMTWDLKFPDQGSNPYSAVEVQSLNHWPPGKSLLCLFTTLSPCSPVCPLYSRHGDPCKTKAQLYKKPSC